MITESAGSYKRDIYHDKVTIERGRMMGKDGERLTSDKSNFVTLITLTSFSFVFILFILVESKSGCWLGQKPD